MVDGGVTVVIPTFNGIRFLGAALASIREQTLEPAEVLVVDAGSSDGTPDFLRWAARQYPKIRVLTAEGRLTAPQARNLALEHVATRYVATLDQDDLMASNRLERQAARLAQEPGLIAVGGRLLLIDSIGIPVVRQTKQRSRGFPHSPEEVRWTLATSMPTYSSSLTYSTTGLQMAGGFDESHPLTDDYGLLVRLAEGRTVANIEGNVGYYRTHTAQSSKGYRSRQAMESHLIAWRLLRERLGASPSVAALSCLAQPSNCSDGSALDEAADLVNALLAQTKTRPLSSSDWEWISSDAETLLEAIADARAALVPAG